jgi:hypothetical protein
VYETVAGSMDSSPFFWNTCTGRSLLLLDGMMHVNLLWGVAGSCSTGEQRLMPTNTTAPDCPKEEPITVNVMPLRRQSESCKKIGTINQSAAVRLTQDGGSFGVRWAQRLWRLTERVRNRLTRPGD